MTDLSGGYAGVHQPDHVISGDASSCQGLKEQVCAVVLRGTQQQSCSQYVLVHLCVTT